MKGKRILAWVGIILLVGMYVVTLVTGLMHGEKADVWFKMSIACTIALPILLYGYGLIYKLIKRDKEKNEHEFTDTVER
ncbi:MAG: hypothetical protein IJ744_03650 [Lachnospiraceae bacterium]|nr:hypothetical protein [Lachnospiraceae bacterium]